VASYTKGNAVLAAKLEIEMERKGKAIRRRDAMIAAITINNGAKLYTLNLKHFKPLTSVGLKLFVG